MDAQVTAIDTRARTAGRGLHVALWIVQGLLALAFGMAGVMKVSLPIAELAEKLPLAADLPRLVRFIGVSELAGAIGLILPALLRIRPRLTALAGVGLVTVMLLGSIFHATRGEWSPIAINAVLGGLAAFVAWGRFRGAPIAARA